VEKLLHSQMPYGYIMPVKRWYNASEDAASKTILENGIECSSLDDCLKRIISTQDFAVCGFFLHILYLSYQEKFPDSEGPKFIPFKDEVVTYHASMFFHAGSPVLGSFDRIIYRLVESGMVHKFFEDIKLQDIAQKEQGVHEDGVEDAVEGGSDVVVLTLDHLQGVFILLLLGLACGLTVFLIELLCFRFRKYLFYRLFKLSVREIKTRSFVTYKSHVIHKALVRHVKKSNLIGKVKKITLK
jgi:hypothetical protein